MSAESEENVNVIEMINAHAKVRIFSGGKFIGVPGRNYERVGKEEEGRLHAVPVWPRGS